MAEAGVWYQFNAVSAMTLTARFTHIRYGAPIGIEIDGSSGGLMLGFLFGSAN